MNDDSNSWWKIAAVVLAGLFVLHVMGEADERKWDAVEKLCSKHGGVKEDLLEDDAPRGQFFIECADGTSFMGNSSRIHDVLEVEPEDGY